MSSEVAEALDAWREAIRQADAAPPDSPDRERLDWAAESQRRRYLAAVMRLTGAKDQLEAAVETTDERLRASRETIASSHEQPEEG